MTTTYVALYEDRAKTDALMVGEDEESYSEMAHSSKARTSQRFAALSAAVAWASEAINAEKTVFGCAEIREIEPVNRRCRYCTCGGSQVVRHHILDGSEDIAESFEDESECCE